MPEPHHRRRPLVGRRGGAALGAAVLTLACGGAPRPPAAPPPQTPDGAGPGQGATEAPEAPPPAPPPVNEPRPTTPRVVIEPADPEPDDQPTLAEAAARERQRRNQTGEPFVVITDDNLGDHAVGQLTFLEDEEPDPAAGGEAATAGGEEGPDEQYWRDRVRSIRQAWADAAAQVPTLEERVAELRRRFYEADDAYYRDSRIKPAWDRALDQITETRAEAEAHRAELAEALREGRLAGALPGWLREGIELEPEPLEPEGPTHEPGEPTIVEAEEVGEP